MLDDDDQKMFERDVFREAKQTGRATRGETSSPKDNQQEAASRRPPALDLLGVFHLFPSLLHQGTGRVLVPFYAFLAVVSSSSASYAVLLRRHDRGFVVAAIVVVVTRRH